MLVLSRKAGERILIGDDVVITVTETGPTRVRIGIEAPRSVRVVREEVQNFSFHNRTAKQSKQKEVNHAQ